MTTSGRVVLLVEPDQATSNLYQRALHAAFDVIALPDQDAILDALHTRPIAALVIEPRIFAANGWEHLVATSRACAEHDIPLIICSTLDERRRWVELGVAAYLIKPALPSTLLDTVRRVFESRRS